MARRGSGLALLVMGVLGLCGCPREPEPLPQAGTRTESTLVLKADDTGPVAVMFVPHPISRVGPPAALERALARASRNVACSAAIFLHTRRDQAERWIRHQCQTRRQRGETPRLVLGGHSWGATDAGEVAKVLLRDEPDAVIDLLLTVDAIKTSKVGATTGAAATVLTLGNPVPGKDAYFVAYDGTPPADGHRLRWHVNYFQVETTLAHGGPIGGASENHRIDVFENPGVNHGNVDDYIYPLLVADLQQALAEGATR